MAIFNMIGGGGSSGAWTLKITFQIPSQSYLPQQDSSDYFGYFRAQIPNVDDELFLPAYRVYATSTQYGVVYWNGTYGQETIYTDTINISMWCQSSTSYSGMSPTPTKAPSASGSVYYFNMPASAFSVDYGYAGTWAWVYDSSSNRISLYQWEDGSSGSSDKNIQTNQSTNRTSSTSLTSVNSMTCSTTGTYDVYWTCSRTSTSGTWSSQLYINGSAYGSAQTTWSNHVQNVHLTGVSIGANDVVAVYAQARGTNYYVYCPQLTIVQT